MLIFGNYESDKIENAASLQQTPKAISKYRYSSKIGASP